MTSTTLKRCGGTAAAVAALAAVAATTLAPAAHAERTNPDTPYQFGVVVHKPGAPAEGIPIINKLSGYDKPSGITGSGSVSFCIELGAFYPSVETPVVRQADLDGYEQLAYVVNKYGDDRSDLNQAAVQLLVHEQIDVHKTEGLSGWISDPTRTEDVYDQYVEALRTASTDNPSGAEAFERLGRGDELQPSIERVRDAQALADQYWDEAGKSIGPYAAATPTIEAGTNGGTIRGIDITNASGSVDGSTQVVVTLSGAATFEDGSQSKTVSLNDAKGGIPYVSSGGVFSVNYAGQMPFNKLHVAQMGARVGSDAGKPTQTSITTVPDKVQVQAQAVTGLSPAIGTTATDAADGDKYIPQGGGQVTDTVAYKGLEAGKEHVVNGEIVDRETGESTGIVASAPFTPKSDSGEAKVTFDVPEKFGGKSLVVFETVTKDGNVVAEHKDLNDEGQTVYVSDLGTTATDKADGDKNLVQSGGVVSDAVEYKNLFPGKEYTVVGVLQDKATGKPLLDADGNEVTSTATFTPEEPNGVVSLDFPALGMENQGKTTVAFETLSDENGIIAVHADINDEAQTVVIAGLKTTAVDKADKDKNLVQDGGVVVDTVEYTNLIPGKEHTVTGTLVDKATKEPIVDKDGQPVTASATFTPEEANGTVDVEFPALDATQAGKTLVGFESVADAEGNIIAVHEDVDDADQTVVVANVGTTATDKADGDKTVEYNGTITDAVKYDNLVPGKEYTVEGVLMDKDTEKPVIDEETGKEVTASAKFTPEEASGTVDLEFPLKRVSGKTTVAFETVSDENGVVAIHADINDEAQTVKTTTYVPPTPEKPAPAKPAPAKPAPAKPGASVHTGGTTGGDNTLAIAAGGLGGLTTLGAAIYALRRRFVSHKND